MTAHVPAALTGPRDIFSMPQVLRALKAPLPSTEHAPAFRTRLQLRRPSGAARDAAPSFRTDQIDAALDESRGLAHDGNEPQCSARARNPPARCKLGSRATPALLIAGPAPGIPGGGAVKSAQLGNLRMGELCALVPCCRRPERSATARSGACNVATIGLSCSHEAHSPLSPGLGRRSRGRCGPHDCLYLGWRRRGPAAHQAIDRQRPGAK